VKLKLILGTNGLTCNQKVMEQLANNLLLQKSLKDFVLCIEAESFYDGNYYQGILQNAARLPELEKFEVDLQKAENLEDSFIKNVCSAFQNSKVKSFHMALNVLEKEFWFTEKVLFNINGLLKKLRNVDKFSMVCAVNKVSEETKAMMLKTVNRKKMDYVTLEFYQGQGGRLVRVLRDRNGDNRKYVFVEEDDYDEDEEDDFLLSDTDDEEHDGEDTGELE